MKLSTLLKSSLLALFGLFTPISALASTLTLVGGPNTWTLYAYGDGQALQSILTAIKLLLDPAYGSQTFEILLLFLATLGFLVMAIRAGFDPGKNLLKMFVFVFVIFGVHYATADLTVNIHIHDRFGKINHTDFYVSGVPAIVGLPAAVISDAGEYLTREIEQTFQLPNNANITPLAITTGGAYGIFENVMQDANNATFQDPNLKQSLSAYISDCVVSAIAMGTLPETTLVSSSNLAKTFTAAENNGIMTTFYPSPKQQYAGAACTGNGGKAGSGVLVSCTNDYTQCLEPELKNEAAAMTTGQVSWQSSGIDTPLEQSLNSALQMVGAEGSSNQYAGYSSPEGYIEQNAMLSASAGAFRSAASAMGNNSLMMSASIAQAEQSQRSSWWTAAEIFKDMMGYVFIVLQAFVFAMAPIVIICLMIPGLGSRVFINYAEILVWLTLWTPLLAIVNFLAEIFGSSQIGGALGSSGLTMLNKGLITEKTTNLVIVSQFMATLVPLLAWGLVKGSLAFTEVIMGGLGSAFAQQAGAQSSTGNMSLGNMSMNNLGMDKYSSVMSSAVGVQETQGFYGAGAALGTDQFGGLLGTANGSSVNVQETRSTSYAMKVGANASRSITHQQASALAASNSHAAQFLKQLSASVGGEIAAANNWAEKHGASDKYSVSQRAKIAQDMTRLENDATAYRAGLEGGGGVKAGTGPGGVGIGVSASISGEATRASLYQDAAALKADLEADGAISKDTNYSVDHGNAFNESGKAGQNASDLVSAQQIQSLGRTFTSAETFADSNSSVSDFAVTHTTIASENKVDPYGTVVPHGANVAEGSAFMRHTASTINKGQDNVSDVGTRRLNTAAGAYGSASTQTTRGLTTMTNLDRAAGMTLGSPNNPGEFFHLNLSRKGQCVYQSDLDVNGGEALGGVRGLISRTTQDYKAGATYLHFFNSSAPVSTNLDLTNLNLSNFYHTQGVVHCLSN